MSFVKTTTRIASVLGVAGLALSLAACSGGQSVAEACQVAEKSVLEAQGNMESAVTDAFSGEGDFSELFSGVTDALAKAEKEVKNSEVSDALKAVTADFSKVGDVFDGFEMPSMEGLDFTDPEAMAEFEKMGEQLEAKSAELDELSSALEASGNKLEELCGTN